MLTEHTCQQQDITKLSLPNDFLRITAYWTCPLSPEAFFVELSKKLDQKVLVKIES